MDFSGECCGLRMGESDGDLARERTPGLSSRLLSDGERERRERSPRISKSRFLGADSWWLILEAEAAGDLERRWRSSPS
jgi:hypothetical protein